MKKKLRYIFAFILLLMLIIPNKACAMEFIWGYTIENYDIDMVVNEDNTFDITEKITANFSTEKHRNI